MAKEPKSIKVRIPEFRSSRLEWRKNIHKAVWESVTKKGIKYSEHDHMQIRISLYFDRTKRFSFALRRRRDRHRP